MKFNECIIFSNPKETLVYFDEIGWKDDLFVLGTEIIGDIKINAISRINNEAISCKGTLLDKCQTHIAKYCEGNSRLLFSVCTAFVSVLEKI